MIPTISGNLSVDRLLQFQGSGDLPDLESCDQEVEQYLALRAQGIEIQGLEDYVAWGLVERREGEWDFRHHRRNLELCQRSGLRYVVYPWVHVLPAWFLNDSRFCAFRCLEHDQECGWPSIFAPETLVQFDRLYQAIARNLGDGIGCLCLGFPADYGEVAYPTGLADWVAHLRPPRDHVHDGFWVGDRFAREAFAQWSAGTEFESAGAIEYPTPTSPEAFRELFARFYQHGPVDFVDRALAAARVHFPEIPIHIKIGHGSEQLAYGIDPTALVRVAARHGAVMRTTQATLPQLHHKRLSTPCQFFEVPFASEPPADVGREKTVERLFLDASSAATEYFDYPEHLVGSRDLIQRFGHCLTGQRSVNDVALMYASSDHRMRPGQGLPPALVDLSEFLRDRFDYEVMDEELIAEGALSSIGVLLAPEAGRLDRSAEAELIRFIEGGGWWLAGPEVRLASTSRLGALLRGAPDAGSAVQLGGSPASCVRLPMGSPQDPLLLGGDWYRPEGASQFRGGIPLGEWSRWTGARASALFAVRPGRRQLLEIDCWVHPFAVQLRREVTVNGVPVGRIKRQGLQRFAAWVEGAAASDSGIAEIGFDCDTFRMRDLGASDDDRELGVAVMWIRLTEEGSPAAGLQNPALAEVRGEVDAQQFETVVVPLGDGRIICSRELPFVYFLALAQHAVKLRSTTAAAVAELLPEGGARDLRVTLFEHQLLLYNRGPEDRVVTIKSGVQEIVPAAGLQVIERGPR